MGGKAGLRLNGAPLVMGGSVVVGGPWQWRGLDNGKGLVMGVSLELGHLALKGTWHGEGLVMGGLDNGRSLVMEGSPRRWRDFVMGTLGIVVGS